MGIFITIGVDAIYIRPFASIRQNYNEVVALCKSPSGPCSYKEWQEGLRSDVLEGIYPPGKMLSAAGRTIGG
jgi:hypothetical protein